MSRSQISHTPFTQYLGTKLENAEDGKATALLKLEGHHLNNRGVAHGGVISSFLDTVMGAAVISSIPKEAWCATISLSIQFIEGPKLGMIKGEGKVIRKGARVSFAEGRVFDERNRLVATAQGAWHLWNRKPGS